MNVASATAWSSMPRASWAVPPCCANAPVENVRAAAEIAPIMRLRSMDFLPSLFQEEHCTRTDRAESEQNCSTRTRLNDRLWHKAAQPNAPACPQLAEADLRLIWDEAGFDPNRTKPLCKLSAFALIAVTVLQRC